MTRPIVYFGCESGPGPGGTAAVDAYAGGRAMGRIMLAAWAQVSTDAVLSGGLTLKTPAEAANKDSPCHGLVHPLSLNERLV